MPRGYLSVRIDPNNRAHHLYLNNGHYWVHYTLHFDFRKRRIRRSLKTRCLEVAIQRRDALFARLVAEGEEIEARPLRLVPPPSCRVIAAAECWARDGRESMAERCRTVAKETPTYWEDSA